MWTRTRPELILKLQESALIQSTESSNRIEGIEVQKERLKPLVLGNAKPRDRSEEELWGYKRALELIHKRKIDITPENIKKLHKLAQGGLISDAGKWKTKDNEIIEFSDSGDRKIRFKCTSAKETPRAIKDLCDKYNQSIAQQRVPEILCVASFVLDFLCIHPFRDGNGRVSRLLTLACLYQINYKVGRFISLERIIEDLKNDYYEALRKSSVGWHEDRHDSFAWWSFFLSHIRTAYQQLKERIELSPIGGTLTYIIRQCVLEQIGEFQISTILNLNPSVDREIVKKTLAKMKKEKLIAQIGKGRGSRWKLT